MGLAPVSISKLYSIFDKTERGLALIMGSIGHVIFWVVGIIVLVALIIYEVHEFKGARQARRETLQLRKERKEMENKDV